MSGAKGGGKADTLVKVALFFCISLLSFSVGTFVGKQVSDSDHRRLALEGEYSGRQVASVGEASEGAAAEPESKVSEKEVEALTEEFVNREKSREPSSEGEAHAEATDDTKSAEATEGYKTYPRGKMEEKATDVKAEAKAEVKQMEKKTHEAVHEVADKVAKGHAPSDGAAEKKAAPPTLPSVASSAVGKYTVQVGSYADEKEAKSHSAALKGKGWNAFYLPATVKGKTWYRVLVGLFNNQDAAKQFRAQFMKEAGTQAAIVQKIVQ